MANIETRTAPLFAALNASTALTVAKVEDDTLCIGAEGDQSGTVLMVYRIDGDVEWWREGSPRNASGRLPDWAPAAEALAELILGTGSHYR